MVIRTLMDGDIIKRALSTLSVHLYLAVVSILNFTAYGTYIGSTLIATSEIRIKVESIFSVIYSFA